MLACVSHEQMRGAANMTCFFWYLGVDCGFNWGLAGVKRIFSRIRIKFGFFRREGDMGGS